MTELDQIVEEYNSRDVSQEKSLVTTSTGTKEVAPSWFSEHKFPIIALAVTTVATISLFLSGTIQRWMARWLLSGKCPYFMRSIAEKIAKTGSLRHRRSRKYILFSSIGMVYPRSLIDAMFMYEHLKVDDKLYELYDYDVTKDKLSFELYDGLGRFFLSDVSVDGFVFIDESDHSNVKFVTVPSELEVRENLYWRK